MAEAINLDLFVVAPSIRREKGESQADRFSEAHDPNQQLFTAKIPQLMHKYEASRNVYIVSYIERENRKSNIFT